ncbi:unnamed protein product, partial [Rotaria magnacalcarata]
DNHRKIQRKRTKTMNFTALAKRPIKGPSISLRLKIAVFQFLSTNVPQFSSAFMSQEILKVIPHYNVYAIIEQQTNQSANFIYLYKKRFRCELFTLVLQGTVTLESDIEHIMSTVGSFSFFLQHRHFELHVLQIHRLVWLTAIQAIQRQSSSDQSKKISSWTNVPINKSNLTNFQSIFLNEKYILHHTKQTAKENTNTYDPSSLSVFEKLDSSDIDNHDNSNKQEQTSSHGDHSSEKHQPSIATIACNPILLNLSSNE